MSCVTSFDTTMGRFGLMDLPRLDHLTAYTSFFPIDNILLNIWKRHKGEAGLDPKASLCPILFFLLGPLNLHSFCTINCLENFDRVSMFMHDFRDKAFLESA